MEAVASATTSSSIATNNVVGGDSIDLTQLLSIAPDCVQPRLQYPYAVAYALVALAFGGSLGVRLDLLTLTASRKAD